MDTTLLQEIESLHPGVVTEVAQARVDKARAAVSDTEQQLQMHNALLDQRKAELEALIGQNQAEQPTG